MFTLEEIQRILEKVSFEIALFGATNLGLDVISDYEKHLLRTYGIDLDKIAELGVTPFEQSFLFGRLVGLIGDTNAGKLDYSDFQQYILGKQYLPLSELENLTLSVAKRRSYSHIKGLENGIKKDIEGVILDNQMKHRVHYEKIIGDAVERAIFERKSVRSVISEIGHKTKNWERDLGRIADTEMSTVFQEGISAQILGKHGEDAKVYKDVYPGACRHCIRLFLTGGIGSQPRIFKLKQLIANGTNIGRKVDDWKPVIGSIHPWCRCQLRYLPDTQTWDEDEKRFRVKEYKGKYGGDVYDLIRIKIGKHEF